VTCHVTHRTSVIVPPGVAALITQQRHGHSMHCKAAAGSRVVMDNLPTLVPASSRAAQHVAC
jgi:hypothetical protein